MTPLMDRRIGVCNHGDDDVDDDDGDDAQEGLVDHFESSLHDL